MDDSPGQALTEVDAPATTKEAEMRDHMEGEWKDLGTAVGAMVAILVAAGLVGTRSIVSNTSVALILVLVIVAAASIGGRRAGVVTAVAAGVAFDFFHTEPHNRLVIDSAEDIETLVLLVAVGLAAGELVVRTDDWRRRGGVSHDELARIQRVTDAAVDHPEDLVSAVQAELCDALTLQACRFETEPASARRPVIGRRGGIERAQYRLSGGEFELPRDEVELPVRAGGREFGRFVLVPTPGVGVARDRRLAASAMADVVALSLAAHPRSATSTG